MVRHSASHSSRLEMGSDMKRTYFYKKIPFNMDLSNLIDDITGMVTLLFLLSMYHCFIWISFYPSDTIRWGSESISIHLTQWDKVLYKFQSISHNKMRFWISFNPFDAIRWGCDISTHLQIVFIQYLPRSESVAKARSISCVLCSWFWLTIRNGYDQLKLYLYL